MNRNPDVYHGKNSMTNYFEGWYFKLVQAHTGNTYCFIPGVFFSNDTKYSHSFIQVLKGNENCLNYIRFQKHEFKASRSEFNVGVGKSSFSLNEIHLNINQQNEKIFGTLSFENIMKWPDSAINPGSMGFYNYLGFMQCYSQVCAVDGNINGELMINGDRVDFTGGKLYIEKNWGKAFPYSYIWAQGNTFDKSNASVTCSIGHIPFPLKSFAGFLIGLYANDRFYKFTTINRSKLFIKYVDENIVMKTYNKDYLLKIIVNYKQDTFMDLYAPRDTKMIPIAHETLQANLNVTLYDKKRRCIILHDHCSSAGFELSGNYKSLIQRIDRIHTS